MTARCVHCDQTKEQHGEFGACLRAGYFGNYFTLESDETSTFFEQRGVLHTITLSEAGPRDEPWPFLLTIDGGGTVASALIHGEDALALILFLARNLSPALRATLVARVHLTQGATE